MLDPAVAAGCAVTLGIGLGVGAEADEVAPSAGAADGLVAIPGILDERFKGEVGLVIDPAVVVGCAVTFGFKVESTFIGPALPV